MAEHVRIDEGVKRGPRRMNPIQPRDRKTGRMNPIIPANLDPETVIKRYLSDEKISEIAVSLNVSRSGLNLWLLSHAEEPWKRAQIARAITALEEAKEALAEAQDPLSLARAREQLRSAQWDLERLLSRLFGQKQEVTITDTRQLQGELRAADERVIDAEVVAETPKQLPKPATNTD